MKNASNPRRGRGRNSGKRNQNSKGSGADNDGKIRGSAQQVLDKYLTLARDATSSGDRIAAEGYYQHAEHYFRVLNQDGGRPNSQQNRNRNNESNKGRSKSQPDDAITKVAEVGVIQVNQLEEQVNQVDDMSKEAPAEPILTEKELVEESSSQGEPSDPIKPRENGEDDNKTTETAI